MPCFQDALRAAFGTDPESVAAHPRQRLDDVFVETVLTRDRLERHVESAAVELRGVLEQPLVVDGEHVVGVPQEVRRVRGDDLLHFVDDVVW